jgi:basic amino acid/polyamine antiporter, APA family
MTAPDAAGLVRSIGRWTLVGLVLNGILGSGVFGLPSVIAGKVGGAAWWAWLVAAGVIGVIMACFAEVASRYTGAGGPYLYARSAFGPFVGIQMGWLAYLVRLTAAATNANLLVIYLAEFWPGAAAPVAGGVVLLAVVGGLALVNYGGVRHGASTSNVFILSKLVPLVAFGVVGLALVAWRGAVEPAAAAAAPSAGVWVETILLLIFAYGGFEAALVPLAEARDPRRDAPFALLVALLTCTAIYTLVQLVVSLSLPDPAAHARPLAEAARVLAGPAGAVVITVGALLSITGYLAGAMVNTPRLTWAMAQAREFPALFGRVHPLHRTPHVSILVFAVLVLALALSGSFIQNLTLSAVSRLATYGLVCLAVPVLRRRADAPPARLVLPAGTPLALLGLGFSLVLATRMTGREVAILAVVAAIAAGNWALARWRARAA